MCVAHPPGSEVLEVLWLEVWQLEEGTPHLRPHGLHQHLRDHHHVLKRVQKRRLHVLCRIKNPYI